MNHQRDCNCAICRYRAEGLTEGEAMEKHTQWEAEMMAKHGWYVHYVQDEQTANYHTHGLAKTFNHPDLQIVVPLQMKVAHGIFGGVVDRIKEGEKFTDGDVVDKIVKKYSVKFQEAAEGKRTVLRIIIPDAEGNLEQFDIGGGLEFQYADL